MGMAGVIGSIRSKDLSYLLGRFRFVRFAYGKGRGAIELARGNRTAAIGTPTVFPDANVAEIVKAIRSDAVYLGLNLPPDVVGEIEKFALTEPLHAIYDPKGPTFFYRDVSDGVAADGRPMPIGGISDPARCPAVQKIVNDSMLRAIVRNYLGHEPSKIIVILDWSFGSSMSDETRRRLKHGVIDYHYDVAGYNFVYASFYITDTDRFSGAHVMVKRSHKGKPLRMLLGSVRATADAVYKVFGKHNEIVIEGPAGTGFVQDTSCYHRASPPTRGDRLMLAIRFIN